MLDGRAALTILAGRPGEVRVSLHNRLVLQSVASLFVAINLLLGACSTSADINANSFLTDDISVAQDAASCRRSLASNIEYEPIARRMPLVDIYQATIRQMADAQLANPEEVSALLAWTQELQKCRQKTLAAIRLQSPIALGRVLTGWNAEDGVFVLLSKRRLTWGDAVTRLRTIRAELFSKLTDQAFRESTQLNANKQAELTRRVSILNALTNLAP
jgi:hypothetical protein